MKKSLSHTVGECKYIRFGYGLKNSMPPHGIDSRVRQALSAIINPRVPKRQIPDVEKVLYITIFLDLYGISY